MKIKKIIIIAVLVIALAAVVVGSWNVSRWISKTNPDVARFDFEYIEVNGIKLSEDNRKFSVDVGEEGVIMWIEWVNRKNYAKDERTPVMKTIEDVSRVILNGADEKGWEDKEQGLKFWEFHDVHIGEQREKVDITLRFTYRDSDSMVTRVSVDWKEND